MNPVLGKVKGDNCPGCKAPLDIEGEFVEGAEYECPECRLELEIADIQAVYTVTMRPLVGATKKARCVECREWKTDPDDFYDGLRCKVCCEEAEKKEALKEEKSKRRRART